ncbi:hypothetical protein J2W97_001116 [Paenibacillus jamilae]|nr:hypothetical protein [Paenibacillus jamilae]
MLETPEVNEAYIKKRKRRASAMREGLVLLELYENKLIFLNLRKRLSL